MNKNSSEENNKQKCAEIYQLDTHLEVVCTYCSKSYEKVHDFCCHLLKEHLDDQDSEYVKEFLKTEESIIVEPASLLLPEDKNIPNLVKVEIPEIWDLEKNELVDEQHWEELNEDDTSESNDTSNSDYETSDKSSRSRSRPDFHFESVDKKPRRGKSSTRAAVLENFIEQEDGRFRCKLCDRFSGKYTLTQHMKSHDESRYKFQCKTCLKLFVSETSLKIHTKNFHQEERPYKCDFKDCNKTFVEEKTLREHLKYHGERPYKCLICSKGFVYEIKLKQHSLIHTLGSRPRGRPIVKKTPGGSAQKESNITPPPPPPPTSDTSNATVEEKEKKPNGRRFKQTQMLKLKKPKTFVPKKEVIKVICDICGKSISKYKLNKHLQSHNDDRYAFQCERCQKKFISEKSLQNHIKAIHTKELPFQCNWEGCNKRFVNKISLNVHMTRHTSDRPFKCLVCSKGFIYKYRRDQHYKIYHVDGRIYKCDICDKRFYEQHNLNKHKIIHSTEKPYACDECPAKFLRERCLQWHKKQHSGVKDYICKICGKAYALYNGIYSHMKTHGIKYSLDYEKKLTTNY